jgi:hypothetical protein
LFQDERKWVYNENTMERKLEEKGEGKRERSRVYVSEK